MSSRFAFTSDSDCIIIFNAFGWDIESLVLSKTLAFVRNQARGHRG